MVVVFVSIYVLWSKIFLWCSFNPFHSPPLHLMSWSCPESIVTVWKMFFCSSFVVKITDMVWEILLIQPRAGRFRFLLLSIYMRWNSFLPAIFWWMGWCQAEFADLLLQALARVLTDGWTLISSNWWCQLGMFTFLSFWVEDKYSDELYKFFFASFFGLLMQGEFDRPVCSTRDGKKGAVYTYTVDILSADGFYNC